MSDDRMKRLLGGIPFALADDGSLLSANSRGYVLETPCDMCDTSIDFILWFIVDAKESPDLYEKICDGTLHDAICPKCNHANHIESGLLLLRRTDNPALLYSAPEKDSLAERREDLRRLLSMLRKQMGDAWRQEWLSNGVICVERSQLPSALRQGEVAFRTEEIPDAKTLQLIQELVCAEQWDGARDVLFRHPELLDDGVIRLLDDIVGRLRNQGDGRPMAVFDEYRRLLQRCRETGIEDAIAEKLNQ